jgi:TRAP-type mannitol/chloroaromatic compound transport system permease small subunit
MIVITHGQNLFGHAFIDNLGMFFLGLLTLGFVLMLIKIGVSDVLRGVRLIKGNIEENRRIVQRMEYAKMVREL